MSASENKPEVTLLPVRPGTLTELDKARLGEAGITVIEHENPAELRLIRPGVEFDTPTMLRCAIRALSVGDNTYNYGTLQRSEFVRQLAASIKD